MPDWDLKTLMLRLLETQKGYVGEDLDNYSCAMVAIFTEDGKSYLQFPKFGGADDKLQAYSEIVAEAKRRRAAIIVTVNHAFSTSQVPEDYRWGDLDEHNAGRCILLTASGPGLSPTVLGCRYSIQGEQVTFDEPDFDLERLELGLLPDWPGTDGPKFN